MDYWMYKNSLAHFGILGQKWGVRRYQNADGSLTPEGKERYYENREKEIGGYTIAKGSKMYRTTPDKNEKIGDHKYVSYEQEDRDMYNGYFSKGLKRYRGLKDDATLYEKEYELTEDLNIPSREVVVNIIDKLNDGKDSKYYREVGSALVKNYYGMSISESLAGNIETGKYGSLNLNSPDFNKKLYEKDKEKLAQDYTDLIVDSIKDWPLDTRFARTTEAFGRSEYIRDKVVNELQKQGYNAMIDEAGIGGKLGGPIEGKNTLLIFDSGKTLVEKGMRELSDKDISEATERYTKWRTYINDPNNRGSW